MKAENPDGYKGLKEREKDIVKWRSEFEEYAADIQHPKMKEDIRYVHGDQWAVEDKEKMMSEPKRPMVVFNRIAALVDATYGAMVFNQMGISFVQRVATPEGGQISKHELLSAGAAYFRALPHWNAEAEDRDMFKDMLACGIGAQEMLVDNEITGDDEIVARRLDPFSLGWDTRAKRVGLMDRRWHFYKKRLSENEYREEFGTLPEGQQPGSHLMSDTPGDKSEDPYEIYIFEWYETEKFHRVSILDDLGAPVTTIDVVRADLKGMEEGVHFEYDPPGDKTPRRRRVHWRAHVNGDNIIRIRKIPCWAVTFATGKRDDHDGSWYGMVRNAKDPQDWANKFLSLVIYIIATSGKGIMAEEGVFLPDSDFEKDWANPGKPSIVAAGSISGNRVAPKQQSALPPNLNDILAFATSAVREVVGVSLETVAAQMNDQSGVVEESRKNAAMAVVAWAFSSLRDFYRQQGYGLLKYITTYIPQGRLIRTLGAAGAGQRFVPLTYEDAVYEVEVDEVPNSPNKRAESHRVLTAFAPILMQPDMPPLVKLQYVVEMLNSSSLPSDAVRRIQAAASQPNPAADQAQQIQIQTAMAELQKIAAQVEELRSQAGLNMAKAQEIGGSVERRAIESAIDIDERQKTAALKLETAQEMAGIKRQEAETKAQVAEHGLMMKLMAPKQEKSSKNGD